MSKKDNSTNGERLSKAFPKTTDILLTNSKNSQRSQNSRKNNYAPNLNVVRNKNLDVKKSSETDSKRDGNRSERGRGNARFNNKKINPNLVQQMGFLSEGIGGAVLKKSEYSGGGGYSKESSTVEMQKPRLSKHHDQKHSKEDLEKEQKTLNNLLEENDDDSNESKAYSDEIVPVKIEHVSAVKSEILDDVKVKLEACDIYGVANESSLDHSPNGNVSVKLEPGTVKSEYYHRFDKLFNQNPNEVVLLQLPDTLPQKLADVEEDPVVKTEEDEEPVKNKPMRLSSLEQFDEGLVGKLIRHRSGKTKLLLGDYMYDVETAIPTEIKQNAVSISANTQERSANMFSLGEVCTKFNIIPDWNWLFDNLTP